MEKLIDIAEKWANENNVSLKSVLELMEITIKCKAKHDVKAKWENHRRFFQPLDNEYSKLIAGDNHDPKRKIT